MDERVRAIPGAWRLLVNPTRSSWASTLESVRDQVLAVGIVVERRDPKVEADVRALDEVFGAETHFFHSVPEAEAALTHLVAV